MILVAACDPIDGHEFFNLFREVELLKEVW